MPDLPTDAERRDRYVPLDTGHPRCECGRPVSPADAAAGCPLCPTCLWTPAPARAA